MEDTHFAFGFHCPNEAIGLGNLVSLRYSCFPEPTRRATDLDGDTAPVEHAKHYKNCEWGRGDLHRVGYNLQRGTYTKIQTYKMAFRQSNQKTLPTIMT